MAESGYCKTEGRSAPERQETLPVKFKELDLARRPFGTHDISFYCDDIHKTVEQLKAKGVEFTAGVQNHGYDLVTCFKVPGDFELQLYQPKYHK